MLQHINYKHIKNKNSFILLFDLIFDFIKFHRFKRMKIYLICIWFYYNFNTY